MLIGYNLWIMRSYSWVRWTVLICLCLVLLHICIFWHPRFILSLELLAFLRGSQVCFEFYQKNIVYSFRTRIEKGSRCSLAAHIFKKRTWIKRQVTVFNALFYQPQSYLGGHFLFLAGVVWCNGFRRLFGRFFLLNRNRFLFAFC